MKKPFDAETSAPYSAQASSSASWTIDIWRDLYLAPGRVALAVGFALALVVTLIVDATDAPVTFAGLIRLFLIVWLALSVLLFFAFYTGAVQRFERRTGIDYNNDGKIGGEPIVPSTPVVIKTALYNEAGELYGEDRQPIDSLSHLEMLAREWAAGRDINQTAGEKLMTRIEYNTLRDQLIDGGFAEWVSERNPKNGWRMTRRGEKLFESIVDRLP